MYPQINCYCSQKRGGNFTFYILCKGENSGKPSMTPWANSFSVKCATKEHAEFYFWLCYSLYKTGRFTVYLRGTAVSFITISDTLQLLGQKADEIYPHWQYYQRVIQSLKKLESAKESLQVSIQAAEKLQQSIVQNNF